MNSRLLRLRHRYTKQHFENMTISLKSDHFILLFITSETLVKDSRPFSIHKSENESVHFYYQAVSSIRFLKSAISSSLGGTSNLLLHSLHSYCLRNIFPSLFTSANRSWILSDQHFGQNILFITPILHSFSSKSTEEWGLLLAWCVYT